MQEAEFVVLDDDESVDLDEELENADWTKTTWDWPDVTNIGQLRAWLAILEMTPEVFKALPVYKWNVDKLPWLKDL